jgi:TusA-related sulfurtransferase
MVFEYDGSNEKCPVPLVKLRLLLKKMIKDDLCILTIVDAGSIEDIPKLLNKLGYCFEQRVIDGSRVSITIQGK